MSGREALQELLAQTAYAGESQGAVVGIKIDSLALPSIGFAPSSIQKIGGERGRETVDQLKSKVLPRDKYAKNLSDSEVKHPYWDPKLRRRRRTYH